MKSPNEVIGYLSKLPVKERRALTTLRKQILKLIPEAEERLSRGVPFFYYRGKRAVGFRTTKSHLSFFIMEGSVLNNYRSEISGYPNSSTVVKFTVENPLHEFLVEKLVLARVAEIERAIEKKKVRV